MKLILIILLGLISTSSFADAYYGRFWRGEARKSYPALRNYCDDRNSDCFLELVNRWLIPATPSYAAQKALMAYSPVLLPPKLNLKYHDEIALILYDSEDKYRALRSDESNNEGKTYGPIHGDIFEMGIKTAANSSRSLVPEKYQGKVILQGKLSEVSYDIFAQRSNLINSKGKFFLIEKSIKSKSEFIKKVEDYLNKLQKTPRILASYVLITQQYIMLYIFYNDDQLISNQEKMMKSSGLELTWSTLLKVLKPIQTNPLLYERIGYGEGGNLFFKPGEKPGVADHYRLHQ